MDQLQVSWPSLAMASSLVLFALALSRKMDLDMGKDMLVATLRMIVQLFAVGWILGGIFQLDHALITLVIVVFIVFNAAWNAAKRARGLDRALVAALLSLGLTTAVNLSVLVLSSSVAFVPSQIIPIAGMIAGNSMKAVGLVTLPGMMSGLMFAGVDPTKAIMYQIMVFFFVLSGAFLSVILSTRIIRDSFFNERAQLIDLGEGGR